MRKLLVLAIIGVVAAAIVRALRGNPAPQFSTHPTVVGGPSEATRATASSPAPEARGAAQSAPIDAAEAGAAWVEPVDGACPEGYPIKAKLSSGIFHAPGGLAYERTNPDRCYPDAASAEADGLRPAKR